MKRRNVWRRLDRTGGRHRCLAAPVLALATLVFALATGLAACDSPVQATEARAPAPVWVTEANGIIDPALAGFLTDLVRRAADEGAGALVIRMDTPGGLDTAMRDIIQAELDSPIPVVVYVHPEGARAASAGVYILMGSDVAAMAPQTNLGAATPVALGGGDIDETLRNKIVNDAAAYIVALAESHGRNAQWAEQAVREAVSLPAGQALDTNVIDVVAPDLPTLLQEIDGTITQPKGLTVQTADAPVREVGMGFITRFLHAIANPDIAYILLTLGILAIIVEFSTPGLGIAGIAGGIMLLLSFYSLAVLPVGFIGVALIVLAVILFVAEAFVQSSGILGGGGAVAVILGGLFLFDTSAPFLRVAWPVLAIVGVIAFAFITLVVVKARKALRRPHATGIRSFIGERGVTVSQLDPKGQIRVRGEIWNARTEGEILLKDQRVEVLNVEGLTLVVRRATGLGTTAEMAVGSGPDESHPPVPAAER